MSYVYLPAPAYYWPARFWPITGASIPAPAWRTITVPSQPRAITPLSEPRTPAPAADTRTLIVP